MFLHMLALALVGLLSACTSSEPPAPSPTAIPSILATPALVATPAPVASAPDAITPSAAGDQAAAEATEADEDFEWDLADAPEDPDVFEIDADATAYYFPVPQVVVFKAKALNGKPPIKFRWTFDDGSPPEYGEDVNHKFFKTGKISVFVWGEDADGREAHINLLLVGMTGDAFYGGEGIIIASPSPAATPGEIE